MSEDSKQLTREVELPRPRSSGVAVVAVASLAMFTAVGASAFVVRVRMEQGAASFAPRPVAPILTSRGGVDPAETADMREAFLDAVIRGDDELALDWYTYLPPHSDAARELAPTRNSIAANFRDQELVRVARDLDRGDCEAVRERLSRMAHLLPEMNLPVTMDRCEPPSEGRSINVQFVR
jgi:hypothetical protein